MYLLIYLPRSSLRKSVVSAMKLAQSEVVSRLLEASSDSVLKKEVIEAIWNKDVKFLQVPEVL